MFITAFTAITVSCGKQESYLIDQRGVEVTAQENREYSYTDKKAGYWYGTTHQEELQWYSGWNMAKKRVLADYTISVDGRVLDKSEAECIVYPDRLVRRWDNTTETFRMLDNLPIIYIEIKTEEPTSAITLDKTLIADEYTVDGQTFYIPGEAPDMRIMVGSDGAKGFVLTYGTEDECRALHAEFMKNGQKLMKERKDRINSLITEYNPVKTNLPELDKALDWITITMDELITCQQGNGIYAGLPWFNEYW